MAFEPIQVGSVTLDPVLVGLVLAGLAVLALVVLTIVFIVQLGHKKQSAATQDEQLGELRVRLQTLAEISVTRHGELARAVNERLDRMTHKVGTDLNETARKTHESISRLNERLAVIDTAQKNLTELSSNMVSLQKIFAGKQARGGLRSDAHGGHRQDGLPASAYTFQATLSTANGRTACCICRAYLSGRCRDRREISAGRLRGFPRAARSEDEEALQAAACTDVGKHIEAMADKYLIAGETQDTAILFVPSGSIYADLAEHFPDIDQKAHRAASSFAPPMYVDAVHADHAGHPQGCADARAGLPHPARSRHAMEDMGRFRDRVLDLQRHFGQANGDIEKILTSAEKITKRGQKIERLDFEDEAKAAAVYREQPAGGPARGKAERDAGERATPRPRHAGCAAQPASSMRQPVSWQADCCSQPWMARCWTRSWWVAVQALAANLFIHALLVDAIAATLRDLANTDASFLASCSTRW